MSAKAETIEVRSPVPRPSAYIRVKGRWTYLYRAVDSRGQTIDFLLAALRPRAESPSFHGTPLHWYQWIITRFGPRKRHQIALRDHLKPSLFNALVRMRSARRGDFRHWTEHWS
jgi:hypothetical protein